MRIELEQGDITEFEADAIVNAANSTLLGGGGVDGAIHAAGGPAILAACRRLRETTLPDGLPTGRAVATTAGELGADHVIHTVGPVFSSLEDRSDLLESAYRESLAVADELGAKHVAFPAISAGADGWPIADAARIAVSTVHDTVTDVERVTFVLHGLDVWAAFDDELARLREDDGEDEPRPDADDGRRRFPELPGD